MTLSEAKTLFEELVLYEKESGKEARFISGYFYMDGYPLSRYNLFESSEGICMSFTPPTFAGAVRLEIKIHLTDLAVRMIDIKSDKIIEFEN